MTTASSTAETGRKTRVPTKLCIVEFRSDEGGMSVYLYRTSVPEPAKGWAKDKARVPGDALDCGSSVFICLTEEQAQPINR